jgi:hypothetical protein
MKGNVGREAKSWIVTDSREDRVRVSQIVAPNIVNMVVAIVLVLDCRTQTQVKALEERQ